MHVYIHTYILYIDTHEHKQVPVVSGTPPKVSEQGREMV